MLTQEELNPYMPISVIEKYCKGCPHYHGDEKHNAFCGLERFTLVFLTPQEFDRVRTSCGQHYPIKLVA